MSSAGRAPQLQAGARSFAQPQWRGEDIRGARIFVYSEQGLGDTMVLARYIPMLHSLGATVYFEVQPPLHRLLQNLAGAEQAFVPGTALPEFDWQCPLLSLPLGFGTELANIPAKVPYLKPSEEDVRKWSERLDPACLRVGVVWTGNPGHPRQKERSIPIEQLAQLGQIEGVAFYSLQRHRELASLRRTSFPV